ncbi:MAG: hypothetical protein J6Y37_04235 [Paludibacteraceae bacterium]|nr:hypothetical protein [Paludibacteraceae bacterium]
MKVLFPVQNDDERKFMIADDINAKNFVCVYDTQTHQIQWTSNSELSSNESKNLSCAIKEMGIEGIVTLEEDSEIDLKGTDLDVYQSKTKDLILAIKLLNQNKLPLMA